jgi:hypothetical protein
MYFALRGLMYLLLPMRCSVERLHLHRGFVVSGHVAIDEVAVTRQRPDLFDGFLLGHSELWRAPVVNAGSPSRRRNWAVSIGQLAGP